MGGILRSFIRTLEVFDVGLGNSELILQQLRDHVKELNNQRPKQPFFFLKPPSSILLPGAGPVIRPKGVDLHYEVELALIIGKQVKDLDSTNERSALEAIGSTLNTPVRHFDEIIH